MTRILYLGTDPRELAMHRPGCQITHYPLIHIQPRSIQDRDIAQAYADWEQYTHVIFTSKNAVAVCFEQLRALGLQPDCHAVIAVGRVTASHLMHRGVKSPLVATEETQEGVIALLKTLDLKGAKGGMPGQPKPLVESRSGYLFLPAAAQARPAVRNFLEGEGIRHRVCVLYDTLYRAVEPRPRWEEYDEIFFTSPSTVKAFLSIFGQLPPAEQSRAIGPITQHALSSSL